MVPGLLERDRLVVEQRRRDDLAEAAGQRALRRSTSGAAPPATSALVALRIAGVEWVGRARRRVAVGRSASVHGGKVAVGTPLAR